MDILKLIDQRKHWWKIFVLIFALSVAVVGYIGYKTYEFAPPLCSFVDEQGQEVFSGKDITDGQQVFFSTGLMEYGSYLGDGGMRGPDFTGQALNLTAKYMNDFYEKDWVAKMPDETRRKSIVKALVQEELKMNRYDKEFFSKKNLPEPVQQNKGAMNRHASDSCCLPVSVL